MLLDARPEAAPASDLAGLVHESPSDENRANDDQPGGTTTAPTVGPSLDGGFKPAEELLASARTLLPRYLDEPRTEADVAEALDVRKGQARLWLKKLVADGAIEKVSTPARYQAIAAAHPTPLFPASAASSGTSDGLAEKLFACARALLLRYLDAPRTEADVAEALDVQKNQAVAWLNQLAGDGAIERLSKPTRYRAAGER